jgi:signal transduction histidine kinase
MHSGARKSEVELFGVADVVHLTVRDSGLGFDPVAAMKGTGLGLISMRERMKLVNTLAPAKQPAERASSAVV